MKTISLAATLFSLSLFVSCKNEEKKVDLVFILDKKEVAVLKFNNQVYVINSDSCYFDDKYKEYVYYREVNLGKDANRIKEFSISSRGICNKSLDTTMNSIEEIILIGIQSPNKKQEERVYFHTERTYLEINERVKNLSFGGNDSLHSNRNN